jgi:hypothetical protein
MNKHSGLIDSICCVSFAMTGIGGWLWFYFSSFPFFNLFP